MPERTARKPEKARKVLVYLTGSLGDSIVAIPALRAVRRHFGDAEIVMLQNFSSSGIVLASEVIPEGLVDRYLSYKSQSRKLTEFYKLLRELRRERFDAAAYLIISERREKDVLRDRLFFRSAGIKRLYGFHAIPAEELYPRETDGRPARSDHEAIFKLKRLARDGIEYLPESDLQTPLIESLATEFNEVDSWLSEKRQYPGVPLVSIGPGCKQQVNEWPLENFVRLGSGLQTEWPCELIVVGGKAEFELGEQLIKAWGGGINAAGVFSVRQSAALLSRCRFHIGLDTGTTHLAAAAGTRCFAIYGGRNHPGAWYPLGAGHSVISHPVECSPCHSFTCAVPGHPCMTGVSLELVWERLVQFIQCDAEGEIKV
jgi:heptosyltransferase III